MRHKFFLLILFIIASASSLAGKNLLIKYREGGHRIDVVKDHGSDINSIYVVLVNHDDNRQIGCLVNRRNNKIDFLPFAKYPPRNWYKSSCDYEAIIDTTDGVCTTYRGYKIKLENSKVVARIDVTDLERDLLDEVIKQIVASNPEKLHYHPDRNPHRILFFICIENLAELLAP